MASALVNIGPDEAVELARLLRAANGMANGATAACSASSLPVLSALLASGRRGLNQVRLATIIGMTPAGMSRLIDQLEGEGFIARFGHPNDRRSKVIQLTPAGHERIRACEAELRQRCERAFHGISGEDVSRLRQILSRVLVNLSADDDTGDLVPDTGAAARPRPLSGHLLAGRRTSLVRRRTP